MAPSRRVRVLRCCSCRLFQAHQEKKSLKWICKACGEKQSFLRTYGEGSGAECRRHVQKLNLLQGQISEMSPRSLEEPENVDEEENAGPGQAERGSVQDHAGLAGKVMEGGSHKDGSTGELSVPQGGPPRPAPQLRATSSKWDRFLLLPGNGPRVDTEPPVPLHRDPKPAGAALAEQGIPREGRPSRPLSVPKLPWPTHTLTSGSQRPCGKPPGQPQDTGPLAKGRPAVTGVQEPPLVRLCDLFETGEDFEDDL
ncbi:MRN complex-interacting protein isoform X4 [Halichoerus grypus]|uniref:MRN complex-interacting protein isoform X4 n=1 Tax=Halichoerus grypus TaxID=9711 RepID=UPI0016590FC0|nr:MRN complex-interacting protein isoform X4 [Halichoerus grypus]